MTLETLTRPAETPAYDASPRATGAELLTELRRPFPAEACETKGSFWYVGVAAVLDRANEVLGFDWSFVTDHISVAPAQQPAHDGEMRDGFDAVVSGHLVVSYRDEDGVRQTLKRPGSDSCFMVEQGSAIKGATSGAMVKAFSTLGVGRELVGKDAPRRAELDLLRLAVPRWVTDTGQGGTLSLNAQLKQEALTWRAEGDSERQAFTGAALVAAFRVFHGFSSEGELSPADKGRLVTASIEARRGVR
jgi:Rad52/22 family double-strand break repair protein